MDNNTMCGCGKNKIMYRSIGVCRFCYKKLSVEERKVPKKQKTNKFDKSDSHDMTMEELDELVKEQYKNLPDWWKDEVPFSRDDK